MPWDLKPPRPPHTKVYYVRGTYCGIKLDRSTGTGDRRAAARILETWRRQAERGEFERPASREPTFIDAATAYLRAGGSGSYLVPIMKAWQTMPLSGIDQIAIDTLAAELYPTGTAATRNRQVYTPVSSVLKHVGIEKRLKRPKGWQGNKSTSWLEPEQAFALFRAADEIEPEFGLLCRFLLYTGMRLGEALAIELRQVALDRAYVYLPDSKTGQPRGCHLPPVLMDALQAQPPRRAVAHSVPGRRWTKGEGGRSPRDAGVPFLEREGTERLFRFCDGSLLRSMLKQAMAAAELSFPRRQGGFHLFCHTYGSWMVHHGRLDTHGLVRTGRWAHADSADRYRHTMASPEAQRSDLLPVPPVTKRDRKRA